MSSTSAVAEIEIGAAPDGALHSLALLVGCTSSPPAATQEGIAMSKKWSDFPEHLNLRLTVQQRQWLDDTAAVHSLNPSDVVRGLIESARVDTAIKTIEETLHAIE